MKYKMVIDESDVGPSEIIDAASSANCPNFSLSVEVSGAIRKRLERERSYLESAAQSNPVYGFNTGVGYFNQKNITQCQIQELQHNLIRSHSCGVGSILQRDIVMAMWLIQLNSIAKGHRGLRYEVVEFIVKTLSHGMLANVPSRGSVGASGDLVPASHAALALIGEGFCSLPVKQKIVEMPATDALKFIGLSPLNLMAKEGLSLINGTQYTTALASKIWRQAQTLLKTANLAAALSFVAMRGFHEALSEPLLKAHRHPGTLHCGLDISGWIDCKVIPHQISHSGRIQDPYSLRCAPQVHGAVWEEITACESILRDEINATTDNPLVFSEVDLILNGGNFHAIQPARVSDRLSSALTTLASISERRINLAMNSEKSGLPFFLVGNGGVHSGLMMIQTTAASLVSECKSLSFPASVDSIPTNCDQEDHVSMGSIAGTKGLQIIENVRNVLAIELITAAQAIDLLNPDFISDSLRKVHSIIRNNCAFLDRDRSLADDIARISNVIEREELLKLSKN